ncbi:MAG: hypothetical protein PPHEINF_6198 [uncultured Paraburkholderia sp.]|nr:MAG: hypothetical protein PPHEINF_6198 [uncultured Paraburkholderia sp.]CAH2809446.1 MAG: hypothetical protein PPHEESC_6153 [uncultured Paraburkholderia sp.]CAH2945132.1 MAG: hypothetical protein PPHERAN_6209 [uncultured Paraburkholderia sp.]CAH2945286.1 MAG: hypothetical protein PPHEMADMSA_6242 [uncultured Paraburkholderia sp.]
MERWTCDETLFRVGLAVLLTPLVFIGLSRIDPLARWVGSDAVWTALTPLFRIFGAVGTEGEEGVVLSVLFAVSFITAALLVWIASVFIQRQRQRDAAR